MVSGYLDQFTGLLVRPKSTLASLKLVPFRSACIHFLVVWGVFAILFCLAGLELNLFFDRNLDLWYPVRFVMLVLAGWLFFGLVVHAVLRIISGPKSAVKTYKAVLYAATPLAVIGWIPFIGGLAFVWGLFIMKRGIVEYHEIPGGTAFFVLILSLVIGAMAFGMAYYFLPLAVTLRVS